MADDLKEALSEAEKQTEEKTKETKENKTPEKTDDQPKEKKEPEVDYKAELEKAKSIIDHKESIIKTEKEKRKEAEEAEPDDELLEERIKSAVENQIDGFKKNFVDDAISDEIDSVSNSPEETELIKFHLKNSMKLSNTNRLGVREAVEGAKLLANKKKLMSTNKELAEALRAKATTRTTADSAGEKVKQPEEEEMTSADKAFIGKYDNAAKKIHDNAPVTNVK